MKRYYGFTMAEVLITIMIIGTIAMIVIPATISRIHKKQVEVQLKSAYSMLSQALSAIRSEEGDLSNLIAISEHEGSNAATYFSENYLEKHLKIVRKQTGGYNDNIFNKCLTDIDGNVSSDSARCPYNTWRRLELGNGMLLAIFDFPTNSFGENGMHFVVDINGRNTPNKIGYDIFYFSIEEKEPNRLIGGVKNYEPVVDCSKLTSGKLATYLSICIMKNGWKIPNDYPVKF